MTLFVLFSSSTVTWLSFLFMLLAFMDHSTVVITAAASDNLEREGNFRPFSSLSASTSTSTSNKHFRLNMKVFLPVTLFFISFFLGYLGFKIWEAKRVCSEAREKKNGDFFSIWNYDGKIAYDDIIKATEDFDIKYCIGTGKFGSVYKSRLPTGRVVALKKLHSVEAEEPAFIKSFKNEVRVLSKIRHRNIVKLHGFCLYKQNMFLVYEYMKRGSLFCLLRNDNEAAQLGWNKRISIIEGIAHALSYMHHDCNPPIVHRDVTTSNVLLDMEMKASVSDFGIARLLYPDSSNQTEIAGTFGYIAPGKTYRFPFIPLYIVTSLYRISNNILFKGNLS